MSVPPPSTTPSATSTDAPAGNQPVATSEKAARLPRSLPQPQGCVFHLALIVAVALALATLFTAWTPGQKNPSLQELFFSSPGLTEIPGARETVQAQALQPSPTFPPGAPTPTLRNPNLIGIVAGHWKNDSGTVCADGLTEAEVNLEIASRVQKLLGEAGYDVDLMSEFDPRLNDYQAAALVSIHNDSCQFVNEEATGYKVASAMATHRPEQAATLTSCLRARYGAATQLALHSTSVTRDMTSYHAFNEIDDTTPAAIIETGFLNRDRQLLTQRTDVVAFGVASGILCYLKNEPIASPTPTSLPAAPATPVPPTAVLPAAPTVEQAAPTGSNP